MVTIIIPDPDGIPKTRSLRGRAVRRSDHWRGDVQAERANPGTYARWRQFHLDQYAKGQGRVYLADAAYCAAVVAAAGRGDDR